MKLHFITFVMIAATTVLTGCQTSTLKPLSEDTATATVVHPIFFGATRITVTLDGRTFTGVAGELHEDVTGEQALRFDWQPRRKRISVRRKLNVFFGATTLTSDDGEKLACDHLKYVDEWRLRCKIDGGKEVALYRVKS